MSSADPKVVRIFDEATEALTANLRRTSERMEELRVWIEAGGLELDAPERGGINPTEEGA